MPKSELNQMSVGQLKHSPAHINQLYDELRDAMVPATTLALPSIVTNILKNVIFRLLLGIVVFDIRTHFSIFLYSLRIKTFFVDHLLL
jgi:hypothetical protein